MPTRKQRRRREKLHRHEYEYVVETEEGEVPLEELREGDEPERRGRGREPQPLDRRGRPIAKPSLGRVLRRSAIFAPILALFVYLSGRDRLSTAGIVLNVALLLAFFIPFSYLVDVFVYRMMLRRMQRR
jgi:hypothetical protein